MPEISGALILTFSHFLTRVEVEAQQGGRLPLELKTIATTETLQISDESSLPSPAFQ
jgi:hypothetical protein